MFTESRRLLQLGLVTVVALIATAAIALIVVQTREGTTMAQGPARAAAPASAPTSSSAPTSASASSSASSSTSSAAAPSPTPTQAKTSPVAENVPVGSGSSTPRTPAPRGPITYTVKRGDNLTVIADWFKMRGYGDLYQANRKVIGGDPDLIRPGQRITVSSAGMSTTS